DVLLHLRACIDDARTKLHFLAQVVVLDLLVPLEGDAVDDRILDHADDKQIALPGDGDVGEKARAEQILERLVDARRIERVAFAHRHVGAHRRRFDTLAALNRDALDDVGLALGADFAGRYADDAAR